MNLHVVPVEEDQQPEVVHIAWPESLYLAAQFVEQHLGASDAFGPSTWMSYNFPAFAVSFIPERGDAFPNLRPTAARQQRQSGQQAPRGMGSAPSLPHAASGRSRQRAMHPEDQDNIRYLRNRQPTGFESATDTAQAAGRG